MVKATRSPADDDEPTPSLPTVPLPTFRQPDPPPPPAVDEPSPSPSGPDPDGAEPERPHPMPDPPGHTGTFSGGSRRRGGAGDAVQAGRLFAGLLAILTGTAAWALYRRGRLLRQPTPGQLDDIGRPLGRILVRYLPLEVVGPTLVDATEAAAAAHAYLLDGPLVEPVPTAPMTPDLEEA